VDADVVVIGAGALGLSTAREFLCRELAQSRGWGADVREATPAQLAGQAGCYQPGGGTFALCRPEN
jgi:glycine/D-amino acid oxidase-like deaminating enzyme